MRYLFSPAGVSSLGSLGAQGLNFIALLLPVLFGRLDQVAILVVASAIAGISALTFTFAFSSIYPGITSAKRRRNSFDASFFGVATASSLIALIGAAITLIGAPWGLTVVWAGVLSLCQGLYLLATTVLVQQIRHRRFALTRISYAVVNVTVTLLFSVFLPTPYGLVAASAVCLTVGTTVASWGRVAELGAHLAFSPLNTRNTVAYARANWAATLSNLFAGLAFQSSALATGFLGPYAGPWAGVVRVSGGFAGISQQVVSPWYDMRLSAAIRIESTLQMRRVIVTTALFGLCLAVLAYVTVWAIFLFNAFVSSRSLAVGNALPVLLIGGIYMFGALVPSVCSRFLVMLGHQQPYLVWAVSKLVIVSMVLVFYRGLELLAALACLEFLAAIAYISLLVLRRKSPRIMSQTIDSPVD